MESPHKVLCDRLRKNLDEFKGNVKQYDEIVDIIDSSYEIVIKEDILVLFEVRNNLLTDKQCAALLKFKNPLNVLYDAWMENDYSHMDALRDTIIDRADEAVKELNARNVGLER